MISAKTRYETHNGKLLAIIEIFKPWGYYQEDFKYEVFILMDHNNLKRFIDNVSITMVILSLLIMHILYDI